MRSSHLIEMALAIMPIIVRYSIQAYRFMWPICCTKVSRPRLFWKQGINKMIDLNDFLLGCRLFTLDSVNVCRKYTFLFDLLVSMTVANYWCILSWADFRRVQRAMCAHRSQMVWFRRLYIIFSRYMVINTLREIQLSDAELEIQIAAMDNNTQG